LIDIVAATAIGLPVTPAFLYPQRKKQARVTQPKAAVYQSNWLGV
jgi:hypothetical protein